MEKLYYNDNRKYNFEANVTSIKEVNSELYNIELDKTYFYPEGGGQPADKGFINGFEVMDVQKNGGEISHFIKGNPGLSKVNCSINKIHRDHFMVQHSGQHLVSAVLQKELNIGTLSVHLGLEITTIEIDRKEISENEIEIIEDKIYELVTNGNRIIYHETDDEGLKNFNIRRDSKFYGYIRVVEIENYDFVPCGGVHLSYLYEIGFVKIIGYEKIRGNIRLNVLIGKNAYNDYKLKNSIITKLNQRLSTKSDGLIDGLSTLLNSISDYKIKQKVIYSSYSKIILESILKDQKSIKTFENIPQEILQIVSKDLIDKLDNPLLILNIENNLNWILIDSKISKVDFKEFKTEALPIISGKGGGKEKLWQGSGISENIENFKAKFQDLFSF